MTSDRTLAVDLGALLAFVAGACLGARDIAAMTVLVAAVIVARLALYAVLCRDERRPFLAELIFFVVLGALGAMNDWQSVRVRGVYEYTVPSDLGPGTLPGWMLLAWFIVMRAAYSVATWQRLGPPPRWPSAGGLVRKGYLRLIVMLLLIGLTRQAIYRLYLDPWLSWLPFAGALALFFVLLGVDGPAARVGALAITVGPVLEVLLIHGAGLHRYRLGWIGGVPLWICLWWVLATLVLRELGWQGGRALQSGLRRINPRAGSPGPRLCVDRRRRA